MRSTSSVASDIGTFKTTLGLYGHRFPDREHDLNDALERAFNSARRDAVAAPPRPEPDADVVKLGAG